MENLVAEQENKEFYSVGINNENTTISSKLLLLFRKLMYSCFTLKNNSNLKTKVFIVVFTVLKLQNKQRQMPVN